MMRSMFYTILLLPLATPAIGQEGHDVLCLQDGRERVGELLAITADGVTFKVNDEAEAVTFPRNEVQRVDISRQRIGDDARRVEDLNDPLLERLLGSAPSKFTYPDSGYVVLYALSEYRLAPDGSYTHRDRMVQKVLLERGKRRANVAGYFKRGEETLEIDFARTIDPDGSVTPISDTAVDITSYNADAPEYEKLYQVKFAMKQVKEGSVLDYQIITHRAKTDLLEPFSAGFYFRGAEPIREAELRIIAPPGIELAYQADRLEDNVRFVEEETDEGTVYRFLGRNCPRVVPEPLMPPAGDLYPRVTAAVKTTWEAVGNAYRQALQGAGEPSPALTAKVRRLVGDLDDPEQKARRIFNYFTEEIRQLWVSPDEYSYAPRPVSETFARLAGNTTDKAALLYVMLKEAGLSANVVLCCPQGNGKLIEQVPCIKQLDDALVAVDLPAGRTFLSLDNDAVRFGQLPSEYQGTRGLLIAPETCALVTIPLKEPEEELHAINYLMKIAPSGDLTVTKTETVTGNNEIAQRSAWKDQKDEELRRALEVALTELHPKARLDSYKVENLRDLTQPVKFTETYTLEDYAMHAGEDLLVFRLPEIEYSAAMVGKPVREFPLRWETREQSIVELWLEVPPGFSVYHAGKDYEADAGVASFSATFDVTGNKIRYYDTYVQRETEAAVDAYGDYKACLETMARVGKEWIVLERTAER